ncbi:ABC transporter ATP-binding protein [bacterium]|nr:ABC transporter ATP-binding protein [bacterium]
MLKISHIEKNFESINALKDVNLKIERGEFFGLLGPNGAGKSTLMNIIIGYLEPDSGKVSIDGEIISSQNIELRKKIGYVPQEVSLYLELSAHQNLKIFGELYGLSKKQLEMKIESVLELVQLKDRKKDAVKDYSGGMKRRLNLAASLLHDPEIVLCDEPTVGVDPQSRNAIFEMLSELNRSGKTIVYTTHYMEEAERLCSRLGIIDNGNIIADGTLVELINLLNQKDTIKIQKTALTNNKIPALREIGVVNEYDFYFELLPKEGYNQNSKIFGKLEEIGIPNAFIQISRATLEDVFLNLTGRSLRD